MPLTLLRHGRQKPPLGGAKLLESSNPLYQGLELWLPISATNDAVLRDIAWKHTGRDATIHSPSTAWTAGVLGGPALNLDGSASYASIPNGGAFPGASNQQWTLSVWAKIHTPSTFNNYPLLNPFNINQFALAVLGGSAPDIRYTCAGQSTVDSSRITWNADEWHHVAVTDNGNSTLTFYFDGRLLNSTTATLNAKTAWDTNGLGLGSDPLGGTHWQGAMDNVQIWSRVLTAAEIGDVYSQPFAMLQTRPIQRWFTVTGVSSAALTARASMAVSGYGPVVLSAATALTCTTKVTVPTESLAATATLTPQIVPRSAQHGNNTGTAAASAGFTVVFPTGTTTGDLVIVAVSNAGTAGPAAPTGWTLVTGSPFTTTSTSISLFIAPWSSGLTTSFTNAASVAAWACMSYIGMGWYTNAAGTANNTNNTTLPTGAPTLGGGANEFEALFYGWNSGGTVATMAAGSRVDETQANSTTISVATGWNNTYPLTGTPTAFSQTLSASTTRKVGVGINLVPPVASSAALSATTSLTAVGNQSGVASASLSASTTLIETALVSTTATTSATTTLAASVPAVLAIDSTEPGGTGHGGNNPSSPVTWNFTNNAGNLLIVSVAVGAASGTGTQNTQVNSVSYGGFAMTQVAAVKYDTDGTFTHDETSMWYLVSPPTGSNTVSVSFQYALSNVGNTVAAGAISFSDANTSSPIGTPSTGKFDTGAGTTNLSVSLGSSTTGNIIIDALGTGSGNAASSSGVIRWSLTVGNPAADAAAEGVSSTKASPGGSTTMSYTFLQDYAALVAVEINAAAGGAGSASLSAIATLSSAGTVSTNTTTSDIASLTAAVSISSAALITANGSLTAVDAVAARAVLSASASLATVTAVRSSASLSCSASLSTTQGVAATSAASSTATLATTQAVKVTASLSATGSLSATQAVAASASLSAIASLATAQAVQVASSTSATTSTSTTQGVATGATGSASGGTSTASGNTSTATLSATASLAAADAVQASAAATATTSLSAVGNPAVAVTLSSTTGITTSQAVSAAATTHATVSMVAAQGYMAACSANGSLTSTVAVAAGATASDSTALAAGTQTNNTATLSSTASLATTQAVSASTLLSASGSLATTNAVAASATGSATGSLAANSQTVNTASLSSTASLSTAQAIAAASTASSTVTLATAQMVQATASLSSTTSLSSTVAVASAVTTSATTSLSSTDAVAASAALTASASLITTTTVAVSVSLSASATATESIAVASSSSLSSSTSASTNDAVAGSAALVAVTSLQATDTVAARASLSAQATLFAETGFGSTISASSSLSTGVTVSAAATAAASGSITTVSAVAARATASATTSLSFVPGVATGATTSDTTSLSASSAGTAFATLTATTALTATDAIAAAAALSSTGSIQSASVYYGSATLTASVSIAVFGAVAAAASGTANASLAAAAAVAAATTMSAVTTASGVPVATVSATLIALTSLLTANAVKANVTAHAVVGGLFLVNIFTCEMDAETLLTAEGKQTTTIGQAALVAGVGMRSTGKILRPVWFGGLHVATRQPRVLVTH